ncbi:MAG: family 10 glycosylhydrolase [Firmicutes bacterium]|nr:family 10 glycosylhydrolase [Bacillota bacterium]
MDKGIKTIILVLMIISIVLTAYATTSLNEHTLKSKQSLLNEIMQEIKTELEQKTNMAFNVDTEEVVGTLLSAESYLEEADRYILIEDFFEAELRLLFAERMLQKSSVFLSTTPRVEGRIISIDAKTLSQKALTGKIEDLVLEIANTNFNTIFVEVVRGDGYTVYPSDIHIQAEELQGIDPLNELIWHAKLHDIDVFPWLKLFFASSNGTPGPILKEHPEWTALDRNGYGYEKAGLAWFSPAHPKARDFIYESVLELFDAYDFAGCQIDYARYPVNLTEDNDFSYDLYSRELFKTFYGIDPLDIPYYPYSQRVQPSYQRGDHGSLYVSWLSFREELVSSMVGRISIGLREKQPDLPISAGIITALWGGGTIQQAWFRQQKWPDWLEKHYVNYLSPMIYQDDSSVVDREVQAIAQIADGKALQYPSLGVYVMSSPYQLIQQIEITRRHGIAGIRVFAYPHLETEHFSILKEGPFREKAFPPHRDLLKAAILRIQDILPLFSEEEELVQLLNNLENVPQKHGHLRNASLQRALKRTEKLLSHSNIRIKYEMEYVKSYLEALLYSERPYR